MAAPDPVALDDRVRRLLPQAKGELLVPLLAELEAVDHRPLVQAEAVVGAGSRQGRREQVPDEGDRPPPSLQDVGDVQPGDAVLNDVTTALREGVGGILEQEARARVPQPRFLYYGKEIWEGAAAALLCGQHLLLAGPKAMRSAAERMKEATFVELLGTHFIAMERPEAVHQLLMEFLARVEESS